MIHFLNLQLDGRMVWMERLGVGDSKEFLPINLDLLNNMIFCQLIADAIRWVFSIKETDKH